MLRGVVELMEAEWYAVVALVLFVLAFVAILLNALLRRRSEVDRQARLPLDDDTPQANRTE